MISIDKVMISIDKVLRDHQLRVPCGACQTMVWLDWIGVIAQTVCPSCGAYVTWYPAIHKVSTSKHGENGLLQTVDREDMP